MSRDKSIIYPIVYMASMLCFVSALSGCAGNGNLYQEHVDEYYMSHPSFTSRKMIDCTAFANVQALAENTPDSKLSTRIDEIIRSDPQCAKAEKAFISLYQQGQIANQNQQELTKALGQKFLDNPQLTRAIALQCYRDAFAVCRMENVPGVYLYDRMKELINEQSRCTMPVTAFDMLKSKRKAVDFTLDEVTMGVKVERGIGDW